MNKSNLNIKFNYLYRDAGNYKIFDSIIFTNRTEMSTGSIESAVRTSLIDGEYFESVEETHEYSTCNCDIKDFLEIIST